MILMIFLAPLFSPIVPGTYDVKWGGHDHVIQILPDGTYIDETNGITSKGRWMKNEDELILTTGHFNRKFNKQRDVWVCESTYDDGDTPFVWIFHTRWKKRPRRRLDKACRDSSNGQKPGLKKKKSSKTGGRLIRYVTVSSQ